MGKKTSFAKTVIGLGSLAVAGKVVYDKYRNTRDRFEKEEKRSAEDTVKKFNAICANRLVEYGEDEEFEGCEIQAVAAKVILDLSRASITRDVYVNFKCDGGSLLVVVPEDTNVVCDIEKVAGVVRNELEEYSSEQHTVYVIGALNFGKVEVIPVDLYDGSDDYEEEDGETDGEAGEEVNEEAGSVASDEVKED